MTVHLRTHEDGGVCCSSTNSAGERVAPIHPCDKCKHHFDSVGLRESLKNQEGNMTDDFAPIDPYAAGISAMRAAEATPESRFAEQHKTDRLAALAAEDAEFAHLRTAHEARQQRIALADLEQYAPPDPYAAGIKALQSKEAR